MVKQYRKILKNNNDLISPDNELNKGVVDFECTPPHLPLIE